jgi:hypothetical protein
MPATLGTITDFTSFTYGGGIHWIDIPLTPHVAATALTRGFAQAATAPAEF